MAGLFFVYQIRHRVARGRIEEQARKWLVYDDPVIDSLLFARIWYSIHAR